MYVNIAKSVTSLIPPKIRGALIVSTAKGLATFAKVSWNSGSKYAFKASLSASGQIFKLMNTAKFAKAMNVIGAIDLVSGYLVNSSVDNSLLSALPGSGLLELGGAIVNTLAGTEYFGGAKFLWT